LLSRPGAVLYSAPDGPRLRTLFSHERLFLFGEKSGWSEVGLRRDKPVGWVKKVDVVDWPHSLCLRYKPLPGRSPVLYFESEEKLERLLRQDDVQRHFQELVEEVRQDPPPAGGYSWGVSACEPFAESEGGSISSLLPILDFKDVDGVGSQPAVKLFKVFAEAATQFKVPAAISEESMSFVVDLVFVVDTTGTMGPFIDSVKSAVKYCVNRLQADPSFSRVRFSVVGYRDDERLPGIEYNTRNFTEGSLLESEAFLGVLPQLQALDHETSDPYPEDGLTGIRDAISQTQWRTISVEGKEYPSLRLICLIGDASLNSGFVERGNRSTWTPEAARRTTTEKKIYLAAFHILDPGHIEDHEIARNQYTILANNAPLLDSKTTSHYVPIPITVDTQAFRQTAANQLQQQLVDTLFKIREVINEPLDSEKGPEENLSERREEIRSGMGSELGRFFQNSMLKILRSTADHEELRDITAWTVDRDIASDGQPQFDVCVIATADNLLLAEAFYDRLYHAAKDGGSVNFLQELTESTGVMVFNPGAAFSDHPAVPSFLSKLPYKFGLLAMTPQEIEAKMRQSDFQKRLIDELYNKREAIVQQLRNGHFQKLHGESETMQEDLVTPIPVRDLIITLEEGTSKSPRLSN
jgi:hypothetical protein